MSFVSASGRHLEEVIALWVLAGVVVARTSRLGVRLTQSELVVTNFLRTWRLQRPVEGRAYFSEPLTRDGLTSVLVLDLTDGRRIRVTGISSQIRTLSMVEEHPAPTKGAMAFFTLEVAPILSAAGLTVT